MCHRGANAHAPENTFAAAQICLDWGVEYIEIDVRTSRDGVLYILHDETVDRTTNGAGPIAELTAAEIDQLDAGAWSARRFRGQPVPRVRTFLAWLRGRTGIFFDVKSGDLNQLVSLVREFGVVDNCFFWFDQDSNARELRNIAPDLRLKINITTLADVVRAHEEFGASIVEIGLEHFCPAIVDACERLGLRLMIYEMGNDPQAIQRALRSGADLLNTNHGDLAVGQRRELQTTA